MNRTIRAIYEDGVFLPLERVDLDNGEEVGVILLDKVDTGPQKSQKILAEIAALPMEGNTNGFSGEDHDQILYPKE